MTNGYLSTRFKASKPGTKTCLKGIEFYFDIEFKLVKCLYDYCARSKQVSDKWLLEYPIKKRLRKQFMTIYLNTGGNVNKNLQNIKFLF